jgi:iron complex transport system substrate-binding protein
LRATTRNSRSDGPSFGGIMKDIEKVARQTFDCAFAIHRDLGPGLLESVYETLLKQLLEERGLHVECQKPISFDYAGRRFADAFRADLLVERKLLVELKSIEKIAPVHTKQVLTYLRLMNLPLGLLVNFGAATIREGVQRVLNTRADLSTIELWMDKAQGTDGSES